MGHELPKAVTPTLEEAGRIDRHLESEPEKPLLCLPFRLWEAPPLAKDTSESLFPLPRSSECTCGGPGARGRSRPQFRRGRGNGKRHRGAGRTWRSGAGVDARPTVRTLAFFGNHAHRNLGGDFAVEADGNLVFAELLDGLVEMDLAAVDVVALLFEGFGDVLGGDRAE